MGQAGRETQRDSNDNRIRPPSTVRSDHLHQRVTVNCFPFDAHDIGVVRGRSAGSFSRTAADNRAYIWRETVSLLDVVPDHELANEWARCSGNLKTSAT